MTPEEIMKLADAMAVAMAAGKVDVTRNARIELQSAVEKLRSENLGAIQERDAIYDLIDSKRMKMEELRDALIYHMEQTRPIQRSIDALAAVNALANPVGINGLTEAEPNATMSVMGLSQPQPQTCKDCGQITTQVAWPQWQPIETAPRDGSRIFLFPAIEVADTCSKGHWSEEYKCWIVGGNPSGVEHTHWHQMLSAPEAA